MYKLRVLILLLAIGAAVADFPYSNRVPAVLEGATPDEVLMYLYDIVLAAHRYNFWEVRAPPQCLNRTNEWASRIDGEPLPRDYLDYLY